MTLGLYSPMGARAVERFLTDSGIAFYNKVNDDPPGTKRTASSSILINLEFDPSKIKKSVLQHRIKKLAKVDFLPGSFSRLQTVETTEKNRKSQLLENKLRKMIREELNRARISENAANFNQFTHKEGLVEELIDQADWRSADWGDNVLQGKFEEFGLTYDRQNVIDFFKWINSAQGKSLVKKIISSEESYYDAYVEGDSSNDIRNAIKDAILNCYDSQGIFGANALKVELRKFK